jgi:signal transduction histidine kinase
MKSMSEDEKVGGLDALGAWVMHELKNVLLIVKSLVYLAHREAEHTVERYQEIDGSLTRMEGILRGYLASALPLGERVPVGIDTLARGVTSTLEARAAVAGVNLRCDVAAVTIEADGGRLREALLNLVGNAIEATPRGGLVEVLVREADGGARIEVRDTGRGMSAEHLRRVGRDVFTTREGGSGLGVVLARSVVAQHGGTLDYESVPGAGTIARITIPR